MHCHCEHLQCEAIQTVISAFLNNNVAFALRPFGKPIVLTIQRKASQCNGTQGVKTPCCHKKRYSEFGLLRLLR